jgi:hypothetical protein
LKTILIIELFKVLPGLPDLTTNKCFCQNSTFWKPISDDAGCSDAGYSDGGALKLDNCYTLYVLMT